METIETILVMLLAVAASGLASRLLGNRVPLPLVQIGLGALIALVNGKGVDLVPEVFFLLFLPPLLFLDGWRIPKEGLVRDRRAIIGLAFGLVFFTVLGLGLVINWLIPSMPLPVAFALAAILSPTDPVAVSSIASRAPIPDWLMHTLEGESLLNDASGLVCFRFAVAAALTGSFSLLQATGTFLWVAVIGALVGAGFIVVMMRILRVLMLVFGAPPGSPVLMNLLLPFGAYLLAEHVGASGILAAVAAGIVMSYVELAGWAVASTRLTGTAVWDTVQYTLNGLMFVLLGEQLPDIYGGSTAALANTGHAGVGWLLWYAAVIIVGLALLRATWIWLAIQLYRWRARRRREPVPPTNWRVLATASLAGVRGAVTLAGVLTLPLTLGDGTPFPARELAIFLAMAVILFSLVLASVTLPWVARGLPDEDASHEAENAARREAMRAAIAAVERAQRATPTDNADQVEVVNEAAVRVIEQYQARLGIDEAPEAEAARARRGHDAERDLRMVALKAERDTFYALARRKRLPEQLSRKLVREIDLLETRLFDGGGPG